MTKPLTFMGYTLDPTAGPGSEPGEYGCDVETAKGRLIVELKEFADGDGEPWWRCYVRLGLFFQTKREGCDLDGVLEATRDAVWAYHNPPRRMRV